VQTECSFLVFLLFIKHFKPDSLTTCALTRISKNLIQTNHKGKSKRVVML
jgi:hypothetical protein